MSYLVSIVSFQPPTKVSVFLSRIPVQPGFHPSESLQGPPHGEHPAVGYRDTDLAAGLYPGCQVCLLPHEWDVEPSGIGPG
jgi:hypothetical protein